MVARNKEYTASDGLTLRYREWSDAASPDAIVYLHGIESHSEWFKACAEGIQKAGVSVYGLDRRGSGLNQEARGHCRRFGDIIDDVIRFVDFVGHRHRRLHLVALSWGGKLAAAVDLVHPGRFASMTLISPGFFPRVMPNPLERIKIGLDALFRPASLHHIPIEDEMFTAVPAYLDYISKDPLRLHNVTASFYFQSFLLDRFLKQADYQWTAPTLLLMAEHDSIVDNQRLRTMFDSLRAEPKKISIYGACEHSLQFEQPERVVTDITDWIQTSCRL